MTEAVGFLLQRGPTLSRRSNAWIFIKGLEALRVRNGHAPGDSARHRRSGLQPANQVRGACTATTDIESSLPPSMGWQKRQQSAFGAGNGEL